MRKHWIDGCFFPVLALVMHRHVHQQCFGESLCCLPPPGTCKSSSLCIQLTCEGPSQPVPDCAFSAEPPCQAVALLQVHRKFGITSKYTVTCWKQSDELFLQCVERNCHSLHWFSWTWALNFGPDVGTSWYKWYGAKAAGMQEFEHELQVEEIPMNGFSKNFWLQIPRVHLCYRVISYWPLFLTRVQQHQGTLQVRIKIQAVGGSFPCCCLESPFLWIRAFTAVVPCQKQLLWKRRILRVKQMRVCTKLFNDLGERITKQKEHCVLRWPLGGNWSKTHSWNLKSFCILSAGMNGWDNLWSKQLFQKRKKHELENVGRSSSCQLSGWGWQTNLINTLSIIPYLLLICECSIPVANLFHTSCAVPFDFEDECGIISHIKRYQIHSAGNLIHLPVSRQVHAVLLAGCVFLLGDMQMNFKWLQSYSQSDN